MTSDEDDADENELREAQALAAALEDEPLAGAPQDALETAALLRHAGADGELSPARAAAVLEEVLAAAPAPVPVPHARPRLLRLVPLAGGVALAAAAAVMLVLARNAAAPEQKASAPHAPAATTSASALPAPPPALLAAQAGLARGDAAASARFDAQMRDYRSALLRSLERSYPVTVGWLEPSARCRSPR